MKALATILLGIALSACSVSKYEYRVPPRPVQSDMESFKRKTAFIELMEIVRDNSHIAPTKELKEKVNRLTIEAGLTQQCANRHCWLSYRELKISMEEDFIAIEFKDKTVTKVDVNEPDRAAKVIYG
jgi:hypothetical protein